MANLFDFITNVGNNLKNKASNLYDKVTAPNLPAIQLDDSGAIDYQKSFDLALKQPRTPLEHAFGRTVSMDIDTIDPKTNEVATERIEKYQPGFFDHLTSGAKENFNTKFSPDNLSDNRTKYGQKGFGYRLGEGLGTLGRFMESPLGRGVLVGGLVGATGGNGLQALAYGAGTTTANQGYRMRDKAYRDDLIKNEQQSVMNSKGFKNLDLETQQNLLNDVANRVNGYRGYITDDLYGNMIKAQQLRDNAEYRNLYLDSQLKNQELSNQIARERLDYQKYSDSADRNLKSRSLDLEEQKANQPKPLSDSQVKDLKGTTDFLTSLENIESRYSNDKYDSMFGIKGDIRRNNPLSRYDAEASLFKQDVEILRQRYAKLLEGGRLSDSDRAFYQKALFNPNVSRSDFLEAVRRMKATLMQDYNNALSLYSKQGKDIAGFELTPTQPKMRADNDPMGIL